MGQNSPDIPSDVVAVGRIQKGMVNIEKASGCSSGERGKEGLHEGKRNWKGTGQGTLQRTVALVWRRGEPRKPPRSTSLGCAAGRRLCCSGCAAAAGNESRW